MNGYALLNEAARLIGMDFADEKVKIIGLTLVNSALTELGIKEIASLSNPVLVKDTKEKEALKFCLAALISNALGEDGAAENMSSIYRYKKSRLKSRISKVRDSLPKGEW